MSGGESRDPLTLALDFNRIAFMFDQRLNTRQDSLIQLDKLDVTWVDDVGSDRTSSGRQ